MKKLAAAFTAVCLAVNLLVLPASATSVTEQVSSNVNRYNNNFNVSNKEYLRTEPMLNWNAEAGSTLDKVISGTQLQGNQSQGVTVGTSMVMKPSYSMTITGAITGSNAPDDPTHALNFGVRVPQADQRCYDRTGVWFMLKDSQILVRTGKTDTMLSGMPVSFKKSRKLYMEDNGSKISFKADDDNGKKITLARVVLLDDGTAEVYDSKLEKKAAVPQADVPSAGHLRIMTYYADTALDDWSFTYNYDTYVPARTEARDLYSDTWVTTDDAGRKVKLNSKDGKKERAVGVFYFLWHDVDDGPIFDHYTTYLNKGLKEVWNVMAQGEGGYAHYWAQPYFGYYRADDEWVIRKHAQELTDAGVDFIYFDTSNGRHRSKVYNKILETYEQIRKEGGKTPQIAFLCGENLPANENVVTSIWNDFYSKGKYSDLWFMKDGKPLLLANTENVPENVKKFFTVRKSWAFNSWVDKADEGKGRWPWIAEYPQTAGKDPVTGEVEQVVVSCGFHANSSKGRSYHDGKQPSADYSKNKTDGTGDFEFSMINTSGKGLTMQEQWKRVYELDPELVMVTGWNEWWAGRWGVSKGSAEYGQLIGNTYKATEVKPFNNTYIDCISPEFSRDLEPMKGGFGDNFYYQLASCIRDYKGTRELPLAENQKAITLSAGFDQWSDVGPEYRDTLYDTEHRDSLSFGGSIRYTNDSGRNDFESAKVSVSDGAANFYVKTREDITKPAAGDQKWMNLYLDIDQDAGTGWHGYDYLINRSRKTGAVSVEKYSGSGYQWQTIGDVPYRMEGNQMQLTVPLKTLGIETLDRFDFKWADNCLSEDDVMKFLDMGDCAPNNRFNYRYSVDRETKKTITGDRWQYAASDAEVRSANENWDSEQQEIIDWNENTRVNFIVQSDYNSASSMTVSIASAEGGSTEVYVNDVLVESLESGKTGGADQFADLTVPVELGKGENVISFRGGSGITLAGITLTAPKPEVELKSSEFTGAQTKEELETLDGELGFTAQVQKNTETGQDATVCMVLAGYKNGAMVKYNADEVGLNEGVTNVSASPIVVVPGEIDTAKAMFWKGPISDAAPLIPPVVL